MQHKFSFVPIQERGIKNRNVTHKTDAVKNIKPIIELLIVIKD